MRVGRFGSFLLGVLLIGLTTDPRQALAGTWSPTNSMGTSRGEQLHTTTLLQDGRVLVAGGYNGSFLASAEIYQPGAGTWVPTNSMSVSRSWHRATLLSDGRVLVTGGSNGTSIWNTAEVYQPGAGTWLPTDSMSTSRAYHTATLLLDGRVLVTGGLEPPAYLASADIYDPTTGTWAPAGLMSTGRGSHTATLLSDGRVLVAGGFNGSSYVASADIYDPATNLWSPTGLMTTARVLHTATLLPDGRVLVAGGTLGSSDLSSAEIYDPTLAIWSPADSLSIPRGSHTATRLTDGRVLVTGGSNGTSYWASSEVYDPATAIWSLTCSMSTARFRHTATLLLDGRLLVNGGFNGSYLASAEVFNATSVTVTGTTSSDPMPIGGSTTASVSANFTDGAGQTHICSINWGDGSTGPDDTGTVNETDGSGACTGTHAYAPVGSPIVYTVTFNIIDACGTATSGITYLVFYDPDGGFVTGGGWINSPEGAYTPSPLITGRASFGFVSKYRRNAAAGAPPEGNTSFHFNTAGFEFASDSYEWLVISGTKARYRGAGTVNGAAGYSFELTAHDSSPDRFRIKIWFGNQGNVIYDNETLSPDGEATTPSSVLGGGSIVIHNK